MATNREKYINNANNEELAATIMAKISTMPRFSNISGFTDAGKELAEWLSQEAEEDTVHIPQIGKMSKTDKKVELTEQAYKDILARLDKLENRIKNSVGIVIKEDDNYDPYEQIDYNPKHEEIDLDTMQPVKTADEI